LKEKQQARQGESSSPRKIYEVCLFVFPQNEHIILPNLLVMEDRLKIIRKNESPHFPIISLSTRLTSFSPPLLFKPNYTSTVAQVKQDCDFAWGPFHTSSYAASTGSENNLISNRHQF